MRRYWPRCLLSLFEEGSYHILHSAVAIFELKSKNCKVDLHPVFRLEKGRRGEGEKLAIVHLCPAFLVNEDDRAPLHFLCVQLNSISSYFGFSLCTESSISIIK